MPIEKPAGWEVSSIFFFSFLLFSFVGKKPMFWGKKGLSSVLPVCNKTLVSLQFVRVVRSLNSNLKGHQTMQNQLKRIRFEKGFLNKLCSNISQSWNPEFDFAICRIRILSNFGWFLNYEMFFPPAKTVLNSNFPNFKSFQVLVRNIFQFPVVWGLRRDCLVSVLVLTLINRKLI